MSVPAQLRVKEENAELTHKCTVDGNAAQEVSFRYQGGVGLVGRLIKIVVKALKTKIRCNRFVFLAQHCF